MKPKETKMLRPKKSPLNKKQLETLESWRNLSNREKERLLPEILLATKGWTNRKKIAPINWLFNVFEKLGYEF